MKKKNKKLKILVACEESQAVTRELRERGHEAYSCDLLPCSGEHPDWHLQMDVLKVIEQKGGRLQNGKKIKIKGNWDMMIAHPPCTYLAVSGAQWYYHPEDKHLPVEKRRPHPKFPDRAKRREEAINFFLKLINVKSIPRIAVENPIGIMSKIIGKPNQIVQPYWFGDPYTKTTCLWLKGLEPLHKTNEVEKGERIHFKSGKSQPKWYSDAFVKAKTHQERQILRSKTFPGFASAMAEQWAGRVDAPVKKKK